MSLDFPDRKAVSSGRGFSVSAERLIRSITSFPVKLIWNMVVVFLQREGRWWNAFFSPPFFFTFEDIFTDSALSLLCAIGRWKLLLWTAVFFDAQVFLGRHRCAHLRAVKMRSRFSAVSPNFPRSQEEKIWSHVTSVFPSRKQPSVLFYIKSLKYC